MEPSKELLQNGKILENIFQYLSLDEQIQCADICDSFSFVIAKSLWKKKYRNLNIYKTPYISIITNTVEDRNAAVEGGPLQRIQEYKTAVKYDKCNVFLIQIAKSVRHLRVFSEYFSFQKNLGVAFRNIQMFKNLCSLSYNQMVVADEQLELIAENCPKLQKLEFIECTCAELHSLIPARNVDIRIFGKMSQLQELILQSEVTSPQPEMECDALHEMISKLKLKCLIIKNIKIIDSGADTVQVTNADRLRVLNVGNISLDFWPDFKHHVRDFRNLNDLTINVMNCNTLVNTSVVELLAINCRKLLKLSLENCDLYIEDFGLLKTLEDLSLLSCGGFTASNLQQALGSLPLRSFSLINTRILGKLTDLYVSPSLETLIVDTIYFAELSEAFQKSLNNLEKLHTIKWLNGNIKDSWVIDKCPSLRKLHIPNPLLIRRYILKMASLQQLSFTSCEGFSWRFLLILIKNLPLQRFILQTTDTIDDAKEIPQNASEVRTSLERILIPYHIYKKAQDFWMDLLALNRHLTLVFYGDHGDLLNLNFLRGLLRYPHARYNLKYMKVCGFPIDIHDLLNNLDSTLQQLNNKTSHYRSRNSKFTIEL